MRILPVALYKDEERRSFCSRSRKTAFSMLGDRKFSLQLSVLKIFSGKVKTRWSGDLSPLTKVFPYGTIELSQPNGPNFKVNGHRVKHYFGGDLPPRKSRISTLSLKGTNENSRDRVKLCDSVTKKQSACGRTPQ
ncbi:hypothetical protein Tco_0648569 [Tanacetum coccineum]